MPRFWTHVPTALVMLVAAPWTAAWAQDRAVIVPGTKVLLDNACVRVQYHDVDVGQTDSMHTHPNYRVMYALVPYKSRNRLKDGTERISERKAGEAWWSVPITHSVENLGSTPIHNLTIELKPTKPGTSCH